MSLDALEQAARAATPGPWAAAGSRGKYGGYVRGAGPTSTATIADMRYRNGAADAAYIAAADPQTVLALIAVVRAAVDVFDVVSPDGASADEIETLSWAIGAAREAGVLP